MKQVKLLDHVVFNHRIIFPHGTKDVRHEQKCQIQRMSEKKWKKGSPIVVLLAPSARLSISHSCNM